MVLVAILLGPWYLRYAFAVLGQGCDFILPAVGTR